MECIRCGVYLPDIRQNAGFCKSCANWRMQGGRGALPTAQPAESSKSSLERKLQALADKFNRGIKPTEEVGEARQLPHLRRQNQKHTGSIEKRRRVAGHKPQVHEWEQPKLERYRRQRAREAAAERAYRKAPAYWKAKAKKDAELAAKLRRRLEENASTLEALTSPRSVGYSNRSSSVFCSQCGGDGGATGNCPRCGGNGFEP